MKKLFNKSLSASALMAASALSGHVFAEDELVLYTIIDGQLKGAGLTARINGQQYKEINRNGVASFDLELGENLVEVLLEDRIIFVLPLKAQPGENLDLGLLINPGEEIKVAVDRYEPDVKVDEPDPSTYGRIVGRVTEGIQPVVDAYIAIDHTEYAVASDNNGYFSLALPRGEYSITVSHPEYGTRTVNNVRVVTDVEMGRNFFLSKMQSSSMALEEVVVTGKFIAQESGNDLERFTANITDAMDMGKIERFGDASAAAALTRIVGVAVTDSKYANVRGLDGRYISSTLNGILMPSTDPMRRDVQLDIFPSNILGGIEIQKTFSASALGTTTGGSVQMKTRGLPDAFEIKVSASGGVNDASTGKEIVNYRSSMTDYYGFDSGLRALPTLLEEKTDGGRNLSVCDPKIDPVRCTAPWEAAILGVTMEDDWAIDHYKAKPNGGVNASIGDRISLDNADFGYYFAGSYKYDVQNRGDAILDDSSDMVGTYERVKEATAINGYGVFGFEYGSEDEVLSKTIYLRSAEDTTRWTRGVDGEENAKERVIMEWVEREFASEQLSGHHLLDFASSEHTLDWRAGYSRTTRYEPDRRTYTYLNNTLATSAVERRWSDLDENSIDAGLDYGHSFDWGSDNITDLKLGVLYSDKDRTVNLQRYGIKAGPNASQVSFSVNTPIEETLSYTSYLIDAIRVAANTTDTDSYQSKESTQAWFVDTTTEIGMDHTLAIGVRGEKFEQQLSYPYEPSEPNILNSDEFLPAITYTYRWNEDLQFRFAASRTLSYPGLIERSKSLSYDPDTDKPIFGNPNLVTSTIDNLDFRVEYYWTPEENITLALFDKVISDPIERAVPDASGSAADGITFRNAVEAKVQGIELDVNKNLIDDANYLFFVGGNVSWIDSQVTLDDNSIRLEGTDSIGRELQGQSPLLANLQFGLDLYPSDQKFTLLVNYFDDRIYRVTRGSNNGPEYELGRMLIDLTYEKTFESGLVVKASAKNLLNEKVEWARNGKVIESYTPGVSYSIGLSYTWE
jgi:TonB-dependent receptor